MPALAMIVEFLRKLAMFAPGISKLITSLATARIISSGSISKAACTRLR